MEESFRYKCLSLLVFVVFLAFAVAIQSENERYDNSTLETPTIAPFESISTSSTPLPPAPSVYPTDLEPAKPTPVEEGLYTKIKKNVATPLRYLLGLPKISSVFKNIGTCIVNGVTELVAFYFPPSLIPIVASVAGMFIPFEPVQLLKDKLPVTSYRRAFLTALNTFLGTFEKYKFDDNYEYDPYMTQRFYRRMMNVGPEKAGGSDTNPRSSRRFAVGSRGNKYEN